MVNQNKPRISTATVHRGTIALSGGFCVDIDYDIIKLMGTIDKVNSSIGLLCAFISNHIEFHKRLKKIQTDIISYVVTSVNCINNNKRLCSICSVTSIEN